MTGNGTSQNGTGAQGKLLDLVPFKNESDCVSVGGWTFENRLDRVVTYGNLDITRDKKGLVQAEALRDLICSIVNSLNASALLGNLPDCVPPDEATIGVKNPFM